MDQRLLVAQLNIEHFRRRLSGVLSDPQRLMVSQLLAEEEVKLAALKRKFAERARLGS